MVSCGAKKGEAFRGLSVDIPFAPHHAVNMMSTNERESHRPGSRMARALRARGGVAGGVATPVGGDDSPAVNSDNANMQASQTNPVHCEHCGREFRSTRGLGLHVVRAHPEEANSAINVERVRARWSEEEIRLMARSEATAASAGVLFMNQHLQEMFPHRTLEAVKGKRRQEAYRRLVLQFSQEIASGPDVDGTGNRAEAMMTGVAGPAAIETDEGENPGMMAASQPLPHDPSTGVERLRSAVEELIEQVRRFRSYEAGSLLATAGEFLEGRYDVHAIERWLGKVFPVQTTRSPRRAKTARRNPPKNKESSRKQMRIREYAIVQSLYKKNLKTCLARILDGNSERTRPSEVEFREYWRPIMEASSGADGDLASLRERYGESRTRASSTRRHPPMARGIHLEGVGEGAAGSSNPPADKSSLWDPISVSEVSRVSVRIGSAPGLDGIVPRVWNAVPAPIRALLFNLLLLAGEAPASITTTRTVFLEKGKMPERPKPSDYRPLSIGSVVLRHLHKILAKRLSALDIFDKRQRGFRPVDGVCENVTTLTALLGDAKRSKRALHVACVDLSKAFDTVSHNAIHKTLEEAGLPLAFREYVRAAYDNAATVIQGADGVVSRMQLGRGVRQGDPLSPLLFSLVVDRTLGLLSEDVGYRIGGRVVDVLGYADDIVLLSSTKVGLQENLTRLHEALERCGLSINAKKTGVLSLVPSGRDKKVKVETTPSFTLGGVVIPQRSPTEIWTYLGNDYQGAREYAHIPPLALAVELLTKAPLKPQQRIRLLRDCLLQRYYHRWVVGSVCAKTLKRADVTVRTAVRRWLRLPHDVPAGYFHAPIQSGGLGMPLLRAFIPILKYNRLQRLCRSSLPAASAAAETTYVARQLAWCENQMRVRASRVTTTVELRRQCAAWLHESCDGSGLREADASKLSSHWVAGGAGSVPGADYVHYHHVRANCLPSKARSARGRSGRDVHCRAGCPDIETPAHCVQRCFRTHGGRILRHNDLCRQVGGFLQQKGWHVDAELAYPTSAGRRRPDLTIARGGEAVVVDAQVVSSESALREAHIRKVEKYRSNEDLVSRVAEHAGVPRNNVRFTAITISWRGVWSSDSESELRQLGLTTAQLRTLTTRVLWGSWMNWRRFNGITTRFDNRRQSTADRA